FNQNDREFQVGRNAAGDAFMIGYGMPAAMITNEDIEEKGQPPDEERAHKPMTKLNNVIDLVAVFGSVRRQTKKFVDQGKPIHIATNLPRSIARAVPADGESNARDEN